MFELASVDDKFWGNFDQNVADTLSGDQMTAIFW